MGVVLVLVPSKTKWSRSTDQNSPNKKCDVEFCVEGVTKKKHAVSNLVPTEHESQMASS